MMEHSYGVLVLGDEAPEIMRQIEERSNAKWVSGDLPMEYDPGDSVGPCATKSKWYLFLLDSGITYCDCGKVPGILNPKILPSSEFIEQCALRYPKLTEFQVGDRVQIVRRIEFRGKWVDSMDATLGCFGTVEGLPAPGYVTVRPDDGGLSWNYPPEALARNVNALPGIMDAVVKQATTAVSCPPEAGASVSTPGRFSIGDRVVVAKKVDVLPWVSEMDGTVGQYGTVVNLGGRDALVEFDSGSWWYPPGALEVVSVSAEDADSREFVCARCGGDGIVDAEPTAFGRTDEPIKCPDCNGTGCGLISPVKQFAPATTKCPNPGWLGTWIDVDRFIRDVRWVGDWEVHRCREGGYDSVLRSCSRTWCGPRSEGWVRPEELKSPLLGRPKQVRTKVYIPWDPEDIE